MTQSLAPLRALLIDMDGVLWVGNQTLPGVAAFFAFLQEHRIRYVLVSNNATRRADSIVERLRGAGIPAATQNVLTSADATPRWMQQQLPDLKRAFVIGETALVQALSDAHIEIVRQDADAVVVGLDRHVNYEKLKRAALEIRRGAKFIATNTDRTLPTEEGLTPGAGSIVAALVAATDVAPLVIGKPARPMFQLALEITGTSPQETAMLGDRLDTDIDGAAQVGLKTILVLTGVSTRAEAEKNHHKPDFIFDDLTALQEAWTETY
ncbi:MAG: HAD-IIA family hydrolase [Chloroflexi bacterium]|nr:HAD-IIA family hydrolase [Chloroflexota bacterium]